MSGKQPGGVIERWRIFAYPFQTVHQSFGYEYSIITCITGSRRLNAAHSVCDDDHKIKFPSADRKTSATSSQSVHRVQGRCTQPASQSQSTVQSSEQQAGVRPFRCGTPAGTSKEQELKAAQRRKHYAEAIREHITRPKTAEDVIGINRYRTDMIMMCW